MSEKLGRPIPDAMSQVEQAAFDAQQAIAEVRETHAAFLRNGLDVTAEFDGPIAMVVKKLKLHMKLAAAQAAETEVPSE
ncbi:MAG: hypothetical protein M0R22_04410 [Dehalococcoidia bacterium]|jgi:hypothetical protein|nr:hypothetical protein [Dehalococcoidia bacterium]